MKSQTTPIAFEFEDKPTRPGTFSFDPSKAMDGSFNQMRSEIGDVYVDGEECCSLLSDEEYTAIIEKSDSWKEAKIQIVRRLLWLFLYEVDFTIDGLSLKLSDRYNRLKALLKALESGEAEAVPMMAEGLPIDDGNGGHYFYLGMLENPNKFNE